MTGPTGLIFAMRSRFENQSGPEALFNEADTAFSAVSSSGAAGDVGNPYVANSDGIAVGFGTTGGATGASSDPSALNPSTNATQKAYSVGPWYGHRGRRISWYR